jgi:cellulose biosynthesis protein BcsQ
MTLDVDPQGSLSDWYKTRQDTMGATQQNPAYAVARLENDARAAANRQRLRLCVY